MDEFRSYLKDIEGLSDFRRDPAGTSDLVDKMSEGDRLASLSLIESTLKYIVELAAAHCRRWSAWPSYRDLVQEANTEVSEKIEGYDPDKASLEDFISYRAYVAFVRFWHKSATVHVTDYGRKVYKKLQYANAELTSALGRSPTLEELSERLGRDETEVQGMQSHTAVAVLSLGEAKEGDNGGKVINLDSLTSEEFDPFRHIGAIELREILIDCLGDKNADLLLAYMNSKSDGFRNLYRQFYGKDISADAARKAKERLVKKLKKCPRVKNTLLHRGETL
jgi:DNA-directed RNA polymerase specialized sigma subunit